MDILLLAAAALFAVLNGANDGGAMLATSLKSIAPRPLAAVVLLTAAVAVTPMVFGTQVATTLVTRMVAFEGDPGQLAFLAALVGAVAAVAVLWRSGLPTSLTLALIGGIVGAGLGTGFEVSWPWVVRVLVLAGIAPLAGLAVAFAVVGLWGRSPLRMAVGRQVRAVHLLGLAAQAFAYGANDGQKMLAVFAVGLGTTGAVEARPLVLGAIAVLFAAGILLGVRRYARQMGFQVLPLRPVSSATAQFSSALAVLGSALAGAPVSMTQAMTGGLIGSGLAEAVWKVRWQQAARIAVAWAVTLPSAALAGVVLGWLTRLLP